MRTVYTTSNLADAELLRVRLRNGGIGSTLDGANVGIRGPATPITVSVRDQDEAKAKSMVETAFPRRGGTAPRSRRSVQPTRGKRPRRR